MTIIQEEPPVEAVDELEPVAVEESEEVPERGRKKRWPRIVTIAVIVLLAALLVFELFTGPIERLWYRNRQQQLAADLRTPHRGIKEGQALAVLQIPKRGINVVVTEGDSTERPAERPRPPRRHAATGQAGQRRHLRAQRRVGRSVRPAAHGPCR